MIARIFYSLSLFSSFTFADQSNLADLLNEALSHNYSFVERSLNQSDLKIEESAGEILFNTTKGFVVNILSPFKERYEVSQDKVTIFDLELNQSRAMSHYTYHVLPLVVYKNPLHYPLLVQHQ